MTFKAPATSSPLKYRPDIDGLRCLAVLSVIFYHLRILDFRGGFVGVDIFFVISGYLISGIIFDEVARTGAISFSAFWLRRAKRILPALLCMLAVTGVACWFMLSGTSLYGGFLKSLLAALFSCANILFFLESGYFDAEAVNKPLLHTWSLGVEEQFYLLFPLVLYVFLVKIQVGRSAFLKGLLACILASCAAYVLLSVKGGGFAFFMLPTRLWELLAGGALAWAVRENMLPRFFAAPSGSRRVEFWELVALALLALSIFVKRPEENVLFNLTAVLGTLLLLLPQQGFVSRFLSRKICVGIGKISYSLYLWHWPIFVLAYLEFLTISRPLKVGLLAATFVCGYLSYKFVEQPFRKKQIGWRQIGLRLAPAAAGLCLAAGLSLGLQAPVAVVTTGEVLRLGTIPGAERINRDDVLQVGKGKEVKFLLCGDSHANNITNVIRQLAEEYKVKGAVISDLGLFINPDYQTFRDLEEKIEVARSMQEYIKRNHITTILIAERWKSYMFATELERGWNMSYQGQPVDDSRAAFASAFRETVQDWLDSGIEVFVLNQVPELPFSSIERAALVHTSSPADFHEPVNVFLAEVVDSLHNPGLHFLDATPPFRQGDEFIFVKDGRLLYYDANHINEYGAQMLKDTLRPFFSHLRNQSPDAGQQASR